MLAEQPSKSPGPVIIIIPAISVGLPGLNEQHGDYLDAGFLLFRALIHNNRTAKFLLLGAEHKGDGFLHLIAREYLRDKYQIEDKNTVGQASDYRNLGFCSVEEAELTSKLLATLHEKSSIVTVLAKSQSERYHFHQVGYGISSEFILLPDKPEYQHILSSKEEELLIAFSRLDPTWKSTTGLKLRESARKIRKPGSSHLSHEEMVKISAELLSAVKKGKVD